MRSFYPSNGKQAVRNSRAIAHARGFGIIKTAASKMAQEKPAESKNDASCARSLSLLVRRRVIVVITIILVYLAVSSQI